MYSSNGNAAAPIGWTYGNPSAATGTPGYVLNPCLTLSGLSGASWVDPLPGAYDTLNQTVTTTPGDLYTLSFYYGSSTDINGTTVFADTSSSGHADDILAYASGATPVPVPAALWCLMSGLGTRAELPRHRRLATNQARASERPGFGRSRGRAGVRVLFSSGSDSLLALATMQCMRRWEVTLASDLPSGSSAAATDG